MRRYVIVGLRRGWFVVLASIVLFGSLGALRSAGERGYEARAAVRSAPEGVADPNLARSPDVARRTLAALGLARLPVDALLERSEVRVESPLVLAFVVRADRPAGAARLATEYARQYADLRSGPAIVEAARGARRLGRLGPDALLGALAGLLLGVALAIARERLDVRRRSSRDVGSRLELPELGQVADPPPELERKHRLVTLEPSSPAESARFEALGAAVDDVTRRAGACVVTVTSARPGEGAPLVAANLAVTLARRGLRVALVESDPSNPVLRRRFALPRGPSVLGLVRGVANLTETLDSVAVVPLLARRDAVGSAPAGRLEVLPVGDATDAPQLTAETFLRVVLALAGRVDLVLVAAPPLLGTAQPALLETGDAVLLVAHLRQVRHSDRPEVHRALRASGRSVLGFVLTGVGTVRDAPDPARAGSGSKEPAPVR